MHCLRLKLKPCPFKGYLLVLTKREVRRIRILPKGVSPLRLRELAPLTQTKVSFFPSFKKNWENGKYTTMTEKSREIQKQTMNKSLPILLKLTYD
jgi:hypothetical protein